MFSITKMKAVWELFKQGRAVANPALWKAHQITATMLGGFFIAAIQLVKAFGYEIPVDSGTATALAGGIVAAANIVLTITTSKTVGLPTGVSTEAKQAMSSVQQAANTTESQDAVQHVSVSASGQTGITEDVVERARAWAAEHASERKFDNDKNDSYYNG